MAGRPPGLRSIVKALAKLSPAQVRKLLASAPRENGRVARLERERDKHLSAVRKLDRQIAKLSGGNGSAAAPAAKPGRKRRSWKLSAETRRKMSEAAKRRYAGKGKAEGPAPEKKRRTISPEGRAKMAAAARARWAKVKGKAEPETTRQ
jgi:hypothetical protein